jgi:hypothetical protein
MPLSKYFNGGGEKVMKNMTQEYGATKGKQVFYATANARGAKPGGTFAKLASKEK